MIQVKFNDKAKQVLADTLDLSGSVVVTELPQVGEEHTIYELQETKVADFPWLLTMFDRNAFYPTINRPFVVIETEEQNTQEYLKLDGDTNCFVYVKTTNKVYSWKIGEDVYSVEEIEPEDYIYYDSKYAFAILKDFDYHVTTTQPGEEYHDPILDGTGHFLDGTEFNIEDGWWDVVPLVLTDATNKEVLVNGSLIGFEEVTSETPLENPVQVDKIDLSILTYLDERKDVIFTPQPSRTISTYWIYTDREWLNIDDIGTPNIITLPIESVVGGGAGIIPLSKVHFYLENKELDLVTIDSSDGDKERGYLVAPQLNTDDATYSLHIVFDNDVIFGSDCTLRNDPIFVIMEDTPYIRIESSSREYDLTIYVGTLSLVNAMPK